LLNILYIVPLGIGQWSQRITRQHLDILDLPVLMLPASVEVLPIHVSWRLKGYLCIHCVYFWNHSISIWMNVCIYVGHLQGPQDLKERGNNCWQNGFLICRKQFGA